MKTDQKKLTPRSQDQSAWYTEVVQRANMADYSPVRGCMIIKPYGYAIWENIQKDLDRRIKLAGVKNAYFPLFIPYSFLQREADHIEGFAPEVAVVTHAGGEELEEKLVVRPTSETIMYHTFKDWIESYRDLPLLINQWANVVRWEKRTTPFLRTAEFLWQEGHTAHADRDGAVAEVMRALKMYEDFASEMLAIYSTPGYKTEKEKFAGADFTTTIEALMADGKALQSGTSHLLGQNFAKSFDIKYQNAQGELEHVWQTSWGLSTRIVGALILTHGDDYGLVIPPNIAPIKVIVVPIFKTENEVAIKAYTSDIEDKLKALGIDYEIDWRDYSPGFKFSDAEMRGIPIRLEIGGKDMDANQVTMVTRHDLNKTQVGVDSLMEVIPETLKLIQAQMYQKSMKFTQENIVDVTTKAEFLEAAKRDFGFIRAYFCGDQKMEKELQEETKFTTRCIPFTTSTHIGQCFISGQEGKLTLFARAY